MRTVNTSILVVEELMIRNMKYILKTLTIVLIKEYHFYSLVFYKENVSFPTDAN
jgi:hypothetical protein